MLTMRKLHLLLAEWRFEQKLEFMRAYRIMGAFIGKEMPEPGEVFPMLADASDDEFVNEDEDVIFSQVAATL